MHHKNLPVIDSVLFDMIGTTVLENKGQIVFKCLCEAFSEHLPGIDCSLLSLHRGKQKREMIAAILKQNGLSLSFTVPVYERFIKKFNSNFSNFSEAPGATELFRLLKNKGILIGLGTGLERNIFDALLKYLGWHHEDFDYTGTCSEVIRGRPYPDMIIAMMQQLSLSRPGRLLKVGDTVADILEGKNAGARTAVILSGTQDEKMLREAKPDYLFHHLNELASLL
ncbi:MAG: HAD hydrolase-like protein [Bacteroidetes bacterium]|nr:HAD hydrolase-like protein [Bacteroidota bacterium]